MNAPVTRRLRWLIATAVAAIGTSGLFAADTPPAAAPPAAQSAPMSSPPALSKEQREKLATVHEQMAACLRSERTLAECHDQMRQGCRAAMGSAGCPGMGMMMGPGRHRPPAAPAPGS